MISRIFLWQAILVLLILTGLLLMDNPVILGFAPPFVLCILGVTGGTLALAVAFQRREFPDLIENVNRRELPRGSSPS